MIDSKFDDIRPYYPHEVAEAMKRLADSPELELAAAYVFPGGDTASIREMVRGISTTEEFQQRVMYPAICRVIENSVESFTYDGLQNIANRNGRLFVSNHRDIMLDTSFLQHILYSNGMETSDITFGDNLMYPGFVTDVGKSNKMFKVIRGANMREFFKNSLLLSEYMRMAVTELNHSVWIAQRNGRTKDGNDATDQGLVKMLGMSGSDDVVESFAALNITPMAISYRYEPCDLFKVRELYATRDGSRYVKAPDEDLRSILTGLTQPKGDVHIVITPAISREELEPLRNLERSEFHRAVAAVIDRRILSAYRLFDTNYAAHDIRSGIDRWAAHYTPQFRAEFEAYLDGLLSQLEGDEDILRAILLGIYANPVDNVTGAGTSADGAY